MSARGPRRGWGVTILEPVYFYEYNTMGMVDGFFFPHLIVFYSDMFGKDNINLDLATFLPIFII